MVAGLKAGLTYSVRVNIMPVCAYIVEESPVRLWGLSSRQRLDRVLKRAGVCDVVNDLDSVAQGNSVLLLRGDHLYDDRVINSLVNTGSVLLRIPSSQTPIAVAAHVSSDVASKALDVLRGRAAGESLPGVRTETPGTLSCSFEQRLRKCDPPFVLPITEGNRRNLEDRLFSWSYKGVTDLVTKWVWPRPAQWVTGVCARLGLLPNHVTTVSFVLVVLAGLLFTYGRFGWGLLAGWLMAFLDTVDGKLARVTVTSSRFGDFFDHGIDLIHPPLWYIAWGLGLPEFNPGISMLSLKATLWLIVAGYILGRLVEGAFELWLGPFGIFCWRPTDSYFRLITGRRNTNIILLTGGLALDRPDLALLAVAFWTALTSLFLLVRLAMALRARIASGPLRSWLSDVDLDAEDRSLAVRLFTPRNVAKSFGNDK